MTKAPNGVAYVENGTSYSDEAFVKYYFGNYKKMAKKNTYILVDTQRKLKLTHFVITISGSQKNVDSFIKQFNAVKVSQALFAL